MAVLGDPAPKGWLRSRHLEQGLMLTVTPATQHTRPATGALWAPHRDPIPPTTGGTGHAVPSQCAHTHTQTHVYTQTHANIQAHRHMHAHTCARIHTGTHTHTRGHTRRHRHTEPHARTRTHVCKNTCRDTRTHTRTRTHLHIHLLHQGARADGAPVLWRREHKLPNASEP